jgi:hypothetical protein
VRAAALEDAELLAEGEVQIRLVEECRNINSATSTVVRPCAHRGCGVCRRGTDAGGRSPKDVGALPDGRE